MVGVSERRWRRIGEAARGRDDKAERGQVDKAYYAIGHHGGRLLRSGEKEVDRNRPTAEELQIGDSGSKGVQGEGNASKRTRWPLSDIGASGYCIDK